MSVFSKIGKGLKRSSGRLAQGIADAFTKEPLDEAALDRFEESLLAADLGADLAQELRTKLARARFGQATSQEDAARFLETALTDILQDHEAPLDMRAAGGPFVVMATGVNGSGKTTLLGKLAHQCRQAGQHVVLAAGDTFRAAAVEQLQAWGERVGAPVITAEHGGDAAALAYRAHETAIADEADVLLIDTAGRLQNKDALMQELHKIVRVLKKRDADLPHETLLVLDGTVGSNALSQVEAFAKAVPLTGLAITKLDGTARGGALVAAARKSALPVRFVGVGESAEDLVPFDAAAFARGLVASTAEAEA